MKSRMNGRSTTANQRGESERNSRSVSNSRSVFERAPRRSGARLHLKHPASGQKMRRANDAVGLFCPARSTKTVARRLRMIEATPAQSRHPASARTVDFNGLVRQTPGRRPPDENRRGSIPKKFGQHRRPGFTWGNAPQICAKKRRPEPMALQRHLAS